MKVIVKSNEYIAIPTKDKAKFAYLLGQYLNKETCEVEMRDEKVVAIKCTRKPTGSNWTINIVLEAKELNYSTPRYVILDKEGNLVNVVDDEQFKEEYAVLSEKEVD